MEKRFLRDPKFGHMYRDFMKEYLQLGHMVKIQTRPDENALYLPHHGVIKEASTSIKLTKLITRGVRRLSSNII